MKKFFLALAFLVFMSTNAGAQFFAGMSFDIKWSNSSIESSDPSKSNVTSAYGGTISPQFGYKFNPKFMAGVRFNFVFDKTYFTQEGDTNKYLTSSMGWDLAPFCRYRILELGENGWFSVWADLHAYYGTMYPTNIQETGYVTVDFNKKHIYGIQAMPAVAFKINEQTSIFLNVALLSLAYSGTKTMYDDRVEYQNNLSLFTMKLSGLSTTLWTEGMYGLKFGMVRTF